MNYSFRQITRLHEKALKEFEKVWNQVFRRIKHVIECPIENLVDLKLKKLKIP